MAQKDVKLSDLTAALYKLKRGIRRHSGIIFVVIVLAGLVYSISSVNLVLNSPTDDTYRSLKESETTSTQFDRSTIQKIDALGDRQNPPEPVLPNGRINPFVE